MNICEGCIKQDVCKFKNEVEKYLGDSKQRYRLQVKEPLVLNIECKYKTFNVRPTGTITTWNGDDTSDTTTHHEGVEGVDWHYTYATN